MKIFALTAFFTLTTVSGQVMVVELVDNGDFETGTFAGWTKSGNPTLSDVVANTVTSKPHISMALWRHGFSGLH